MIYLKKYISYILVTVLVVCNFQVMAQKDISAKLVLSNPVVSSEGVVTWDCVYFGKYPQSDKTGEASEEIKWRVLSVSEEEVLLIADSNLDVQRYNDSFGAVTWENSTLRSWLNDYFLNKAFSKEEQNYILDTVVKNSVDNQYGISGGNDTVDKVFILSADEAMNVEYGFAGTTGEDSGRVRRNTAYVAAGGYLANEGSNAYEAGSPDIWWLRTLGEAAYNAATVQFKGDISLAGDIVSLKNCVVCPVIKLDISGELWSYAGTVNSNEEADDGVEETTILETVSEETSTEEKTSEQITTVEYATTEKSTTVDMEKKTTPVFVENNTANTQAAGKDGNAKIKLSKSRIKKAIKKKKAKSIKVSFKKVKNAAGYEVAFSTTRKFKKTLIKKSVKKISVIIKNKKFKGKKKLYVRVRAVVVKDGTKYYGKWSKIKNVKIK